MKMKYAVSIKIPNYFEPLIHYRAVDRRPEDDETIAAINALSDALPDDENVQVKIVSDIRDGNEEITGWEFQIFGKQHETGNLYVAEIIVIKI